MTHFFLFKAGLFLPKKDGCLCLCHISAVPEPLSFHAVSQVPVYSQYQSIYLYVPLNVYLLFV